MNDRDLNDSDLDQAIRSLVASAVAATPPAPELPALDELPATTSVPRRADRTGWIMAGAGIAAAAALVGVLVWANDDDDKTIVAASTTLEPATTDAVTVPPTIPATTEPSSTDLPTTVPNTSPTPPGVPDQPGVVVTAGPDGVWRVTDGVAEQLVMDRMSMVLQLPDGSLIMQRSSGYPSGADGTYPATDTSLLGWSEAAGVYELFPDDPPTTWLRLHDVALVNGELTLLYSAEVEALPQAGSDNQLLARSLDTGEITVVAEEFGGWEQGVSRMHLAETGLIVGESYSEAYRSLVSYSINGAAPINAATLGVDEGYADCETCPRVFTVSRDGSTVAWLDGSRLMRLDLSGTIEYESIDLGDASTLVDELDLGNGFATLTYFGYPTTTAPHVVAVAVVDPTPPWQVDEELTAALAGQEFARGEEFYAAEQQIANLKYGPNEDAFGFGRRILTDGSAAIIAPNFDDSVPESWYRIVADRVDDRTVVIVRIESVAVCRNFTFSTPTHLCV
jgi:hypothetical protein